MKAIQKDTTTRMEGKQEHKPITDYLSAKRIRKTESSMSQLAKGPVAADLLDIAQQSYATQDPVVRILIGFQVYACDVG